MNNLIRKKLGIAVISGCLMTWVGIAQAGPGSAFEPAPLVVFSNGNIADADDVNANFNELENRIEIITHTAGKGDRGRTGRTGRTGPAGPAGADSTVAGPTGPAGADSTVAGPTGPAGLGLGAVVFNSAPKVTDDMNSHTVGTVWIDTSGPTAYILVDNTAGGAVWTALGGSATGSLYAIGDTGPAGGIVFHVTDDGLHGLEAATVDQTSAEWGCAGTPITGANGKAVGTGEQNTADIIEFCDAITAASVAAAYGPGWYLPSKDELNLLHVQKVADVVGGFASYYYWSSSQGGSGIDYGLDLCSSQGSSGLALNQQFFGSEGNQIDGCKESSSGVRAVRTF
jgi:hypothetical protein